MKTDLRINKDAYLKKFALAAVVWLGLFITPLALAAPVGEVVFVVGDVRVQGVAAPIKRGVKLDIGQIINTGANGHVHIRFIDQAFVSIRPDSELHIEQYVYDAANPDNNRVKFFLAQGTSRLITGKAGQAAKQNFRLNTPVAAIGVRGTDFLVQADQNITRVAVQQGAVVVSPFGQDCSVQTLGPCGGSQALDLLGSLTGRYLEVKPQVSPILIAPDQAGAKRPFSLPRPEEPKVNTEGTTAKSASLPAGLQGSSALMWGRWSSAAATPAGFELLGQNDAFVLYRPQDNVNLPQSGFINFNVVEAQGYARTSSGVLNPASISAPSLAVNFGTMQYVTKFNWEAEGKQLQLTNKGAVTNTGHFIGNRDKSNFALSGGLNGAGDEAAYLFIKRLQGDDAYGVIRWAK
jgi:hypothetical protein